MNLRDAIESAKVAWATAVSTAGTGLGTVLALIPEDIGKLATVVGIVLSCVLIWTHLRKGAAEYTKTQLEIAALREEAGERHRIAEARRNAGLPIRRGDDLP